MTVLRITWKIICEVHPCEYPRERNGVNTGNGTLMATLLRVYHVLTHVGDSELMIYKIVNRWPADDYNIIQQSPVAHPIVEPIPSTKRLCETREIRANDRNNYQKSSKIISE